VTAPVDNHSDGVLSFATYWGVVEWLLTGLISAVIGISTFAWRQATEVRTLKVRMDTVESWQTDHNEETHERVREINGKIEAIREGLPDKQFIIERINQLSDRIDRLIDAKLAR